MEQFHYKNGQCEQCGLSIEQVGFLQIINFWYINNARLIPYYLYVCDTCFNTRKSWCKNIFPDYCEICNALIEEGEHCLEKKLNKEGNSIATYGLEQNEKCKIICFGCKKN